MKTVVSIAVLLLFAALALTGSVLAANVVPTDVQQPGTQPKQVSNLETPDKCDNCHGGYNTTTEPAYNWRGSMMAQAGRDPIFWATVGIVEQDFDGAGDLCIRCHAPAGWLGGRSTPTDGSGLASGDGDGVECDMCHKLTNTDDTELLGVMTAPFIANNGTGDGYYGSGMYSIWAGNQKLGPYATTNAKHQFRKSNFHRQSEFCGTCHDVSNPVVGDLAHNNGAPLEGVTSSGVPGSPVSGKAAFNNHPYQYGVVERTFSEHMSSLWPLAKVDDYDTLDPSLQSGAIMAAYESARGTKSTANYEDGTIRNFTCQTCHLRAITGQGCNKNPAIRTDLPLHDMTGGNYWMPDAIKWLDARGLLRLGGGMSSVQLAALDSGKTRALKQLAQAATLTVTGNDVKITNLTGHKLITGYPEGRRMWLNIKWYGPDSIPLGEDGAYGELTVSLPGNDAFTVRTLLDLDGANTKIYEAHYGMTKEWATQLTGLGYSSDLVLSYDRETGTVDYTLGQLASQPDGSYHETFHFALNNMVVKDNRIPPYGMSYDASLERNCQPVPADQYGAPASGGTYNHYDVFTLTPPAGAKYAEIKLMYQPTSWEYIQFLYLANKQGNAFLRDEGVNLLNAWLATGMAEPYVMASATWTCGAQETSEVKVAAAVTTWTVNKNNTLGVQSSTFTASSSVGIKSILSVDGTVTPVSGAQVFVEVRNASGATVASMQGFTDASGAAAVFWNTVRTTPKGEYTANVVKIIKNGYVLKEPASKTFTLK